MYGVFPENLLMTIIHHQYPEGRWPGVDVISPSGGGPSPPTHMEHDRGRMGPAAELAHPPSLLLPPHPRRGPRGQMIGPRPHSKCSDLEPRRAVPWAESLTLTSPEATNLPGPSLGTADVIAFETKLIYSIWNSPQAPLPRSLPVGPLAVAPAFSLSRPHQTRQWVASLTPSRV